MSIKPTAFLILSALLLGTAAQAQSTTVRYRCSEGKPLTVTYTMGETRMTARVKIDGIQRVMTLDNQNEDDSLSVFSGEEHQMLTDPMNVNTLRTAGVTSLSNEVQQVQFENCRPVRGR
ncbi:MAG: hypothetical protein Q4G70_03185 [Pseudomonadota bacterium]|nr:hypothetical protein [Pseudomonadota bacterium]